MNIKFENGSSIETIDILVEPKRGQRAKIYPVDDKCWKSQFIGEWIKQIDCNNCRWLDLTEDEQQDSGDKCHRNHYCTYYRKIVKHRTNNLIHNPYLYPCNECDKENNEHYCDGNGE